MIDKENNQIKSAISSFLTVAKFIGISVNGSDILELLENASVKEAEIFILQCAKHYKLKSKLIKTDLNRLIKNGNKILPLIAKDKDNNFLL